MTTLAIDIGGTKLAAAQVGDNLQIVSRRELPTPASHTPQALAGALKSLIQPLLPGAACIAVASTGIIHQGVLTAINPANLGGLAAFPLVETLSALSGLPCVALNDAQAAALAEFHALRVPVQEMVFITVSTGVGGGLVSGGKLLIGPGGLAGHIGHTQADPHGPRCGCGRIGCVEAIASGRGIAAAASGNLQGLDCKTIFSRAAWGDSQACELVAHSARTLAALIADVKALTDCECAVVGGSVGLAEGYLAQVRGFLAEQPAAFQTPLRAAHYRHDAGLLGAALWAQGVTR
ncbi:N-acetylmannosamine kinase [Yokenella regensburgei]|uniref:N-acetylmannosamine kinase n=1 Tax=Yokenella regensburgei TaxID=158877 RepID=UPI003EDB1C29